MAYSAYEDSFSDTLKKFAPVIATVAIVLLVLLGGFFGLRAYFGGGSSEVSEATFIRDWNFRTGNTEASVQVIYLFDFQCPACAANDENIKSLVDIMGDDIGFVYKNFPLTSIHPFAKPAAYGGQAVAQLNPDAYLQYKSLIFERQSRLSNDTIREVAREVDVDYDEWENLFNSGDIRDQVDQDFNDITNIEFAESSYGGGVTPDSTPSTVIFKDGQSVDWWGGVVTTEEMQTRVEQYL
jgi:predicted DsbA family dithiol-disulfide isomerase